MHARRRISNARLLVDGPEQVHGKSQVGMWNITRHAVPYVQRAIGQDLRLEYWPRTPMRRMYRITNVVEIYVNTVLHDGARYR